MSEGSHHINPLLGPVHEKHLQDEKEKQVREQNRKDKNNKMQRKAAEAYRVYKANPMANLGMEHLKALLLYTRDKQQTSPDPP